MKIKLPLTTAIAALGLIAMPVNAETTTEEKPATKVAADQKTVPAYIVVFSGQGWGVTRKASLALNAQDGVKTILLSGYRATVLMNDGKEMDKEAVTKAFAKGNLTLKSFEKNPVIVPKSGYQLAVTGTGWATSNDKARVALEKMDGVTAAYVNDGITLHLASADGYDQAKVVEVLKPFKMVVKSSTKLDKLPF